MKKFLFLFILTLFSSCNLFKSTYFNKLDDNTKKQFIPKTINNFNLEKLESGVYSINALEFHSILQNSKTEFIIYFPQHIYCSGIEVLLQLIYDKFGEKITILSISSHDWVYKNDYEQYLKNHNFLKQCFLIDNNDYGKYEKWHENGTVWLRANKFLYDVLSLKDKDKLAEINDELYTPPLVLFDREGDSLIEFENNNNCYNPNFEICQEHIDKLINKIDKIINN